MMLKSIVVVFTSVIAVMASGVPVADMSPEMLGIEYYGTVSGQTITKAEVPSRFQSHYFMLHYAPVSFLLLSAGIGGAAFETDEFDSSCFKGDGRFSPKGGFMLTSPKLAGMVVINGGIDAAIINSADEDYRYNVMVLNPFVGAAVSVNSILDIGAGVKGHILNGTMKFEGTEKSFSNNTNVHGYLSGTLHSSRERAYATLTFDISPNSSKDWSFAPNEASISLKVGYFIKSDKKAKSKDSPTRYLNGFRKMKETQDEIAKEMEE